MGRSTEFYRKNKAAREKKQATTDKLNQSPSMRKKRTESQRARRKAKREGKNIKGKDAAHTKNGIVFKDASKNRGSNKDSAGDKRARGSKQK